MDKEFWKGKKVFITGQTGFKGSWLCLWLKKLDADVLGYSLIKPVSEPCLFDLCLVNSAGINPVGDSIFADVRDFQSLHRVIDAFSPEIVIHMAAQTIVRESYRDPLETYSTNIMGTVNLLEAVRQCPSVKYTVVVTSDKATEPGRDPYSVSKACQESITLSYHRAFDLPVTTARAGNCIGGGDWGKDRLIPDCVRSTLKAETIKVRNPRHTRPWQHVLDCLYGYLLMLQEKPLSPWNLVPEEKWTVGELVSNFCVRWEGAKWEIVQEDGPIEQGQIWQKFIRPRNWEPKWGLDKTLDKTVEWYKAYQAGQDMREVCLRQIEQYENG